MTTLGRKGSWLCLSSALKRLPFMMLDARSSAGWLSVVRMCTILRRCDSKFLSRPPCFCNLCPRRGGRKQAVQKTRMAFAVAETKSSALPPFSLMQPNVPEHTVNWPLHARKRRSSFPLRSSQMRQSVRASSNCFLQIWSKASERHQRNNAVLSLHAPPSLSDCPLRTCVKVAAKSCTEGARDRSS